MFFSMKILEVEILLFFYEFFTEQFHCRSTIYLYIILSSLNCYRNIKNVEKCINNIIIRHLNILALICLDTIAFVMLKNIQGQLARTLTIFEMRSNCTFDTCLFTFEI